MACRRHSVISRCSYPINLVPTKDGIIRSANLFLVRVDRGRLLEITQGFPILGYYTDIVLLGILEQKGRVQAASRLFLP